MTFVRLYCLNFISNSIFPQSILGDAPIEKGWRGLIPIRSTGSEVENKLGLLKEIEVNHFRYENADLMVSIVYSKEPCSGKESGSYMNVPKDTVLDMLVAPKKQLLTSELNWDRKKYRKQLAKNPGDWTTYFNSEDSINVLVTKRGKTPEQVVGIYYRASPKYDYLICK